MNPSGLRVPAEMLDFVGSQDYLGPVRSRALDLDVCWHSRSMANEVEALRTVDIFDPPYVGVVRDGCVHGVGFDGHLDLLVQLEPLLDADGHVRLMLPRRRRLGRLLAA